MRRKHSEVTDPNEIDRILSLTNIGRMATIGKDGYPYITPVNFVSLNANIYFHCAPKGEKLNNLRDNPRVCFEVDVPLSYIDRALDPTRPTCHLHQYYHCVIIRGTGAVVEDTQLKVAALNALVARHEGNDDFEPVEANMPLCQACRVIEIKPESVTAKSDFSQNQPEKNRRTIAEYLHKRNQPGDRESVRAMGFTFK